MTRVSSASSTLVSSVVPLASAASSSARFDRLLEPGSRTWPLARAIGAIVSAVTGRTRDSPRG